MSDFSRERLLRLFTTAPGAFWRHDVDVSLDAAAAMARFAAEIADVRCTFYVMVAGEHYNPFSPVGRRRVQEIEALGHRVGLHADGDWRDVAWQQHLLASALGALVRPELVSFHKPSDGVLWRDFAGFENAYASRWRDCYVSDSRRQFGPEKEDRVQVGMQVNLHPEHWFGA